MEERNPEEMAEKPSVKIGLFTDSHFAEKSRWRDRFYRQSKRKLRTCIDRFNDLEVDFVVNLGDLIDAADSKQEELENLEMIVREFGRFRGPRHSVLGNHCLHSLRKREFLEQVGGRDSGFYSFDFGGFHFVILDGCYRSDGVSYEEGNFDWTDSDIPLNQRKWLREDLGKDELPAIVFLHQRLDGSDRYSVAGAKEVRRILEESKRVRAVFQGHSHENDYRKIGGIHYVTLRAMVEGSGEENNSYGVLETFGENAMQLKGFGKQVSRDLG